jgi:methyl-accepting chemotaxis protein
MMKQDVLESKNSLLKEGEFYLHPLLAPAIPAVAVVLIGAYGLQWVGRQNAILFIVVFLLLALGIFVGERKIMALVQAEQDRSCVELTMVCREFVAGNRELKAPDLSNGEMSKLAEAINLLLEHHRQLIKRIESAPPPAPPPLPVSPPPNDEEAQMLKQQLMQVINGLSPVTNGDLRVKVVVSEDLVGAIADACNSFIEELARFVKWTRYAAQVVTTTSQGILDRSVEMAKNTESQMHRLSQTTNNIEEITSFMQHLSNTLHLSFDIAKELQRNIQEKIQNKEQITDTSLSQLLNEMQSQTELLEGVLDSTNETSDRAESLIGDLYTVAEQLYESSVSALKTVERLSELEALAQRWHRAANAFTIEDDEDEEAMKEPWLL